MPTEGRLVVIDDPLLGCIPKDVGALLQARGHHPVVVDPEAFMALGGELQQVEVVVAGVRVRFDEERMRQMPRLKAIVSAVVGTDFIDVAAASRRGIHVANSPAPETSEGMAEASLLLILACLYDLPSRVRECAESWQRPPRPTARMLQGRTVGLVGYGRTAKALARRLSGFDVRILGYDRGRARVDGEVTCVSLEELLAESDVVSVHLALNAETRNILDERRLGLMRSGSVLVNTARGGLVDEAALARLVRQGRISAVGLDVFATEPLPADSPLRGLPNSLLTPHSIGHTQESFRALAEMACENAHQALSGAIPPYTINADAVAVAKAVAP